MRWVRSMNMQSLVRGLAISCGIGISLLGVASVSQAEPGSGTPSAETLGQTNNQPTLVLPFTDVPPDHWAYQALLNLAGTYGCVSGYPDGTFRGERAMTRYEFAAGMNSCLGSLSNLVTQQDGSSQAEVEALIDDMERSLDELRQLEQRLPDTP